MLQGRSSGKKASASAEDQILRVLFQMAILIERDPIPWLREVDEGNGKIFLTILKKATFHFTIEYLLSRRSIGVKVKILIWTVGQENLL